MQRQPPAKSCQRVKCPKCSPACSSCVCRLLDDLHELRAFLLQRAAEQDSATPASLAAAMPEDLQLWETSGASSAALAGIDEALAVFTGPRATQLLMIQVRDNVLYESSIRRQPACIGLSV